MGPKYDRKNDATCIALEHPHFTIRSDYPDGDREFNLTECVWFSLSSVTPQGGGDTPKPLSSRVLVAGYWLFVGEVSFLMLM